MLTKNIKRDEVPSCRQLKDHHYDKISAFSLVSTKSIVKIDQSSKIFFSTVVKKEHGFQGKHKQVHYQQFLLVAFQKTGEVNVGYILKTGGISTFQNYQSFVQHYLPLTKCRDIQSISDKEIVFFFHQNQQNKEWKFKFYQKEIKQRWMLLLMILAYQKEYKQSIQSIFSEEIIMQLCKENLNYKKYTSEIKMRHQTLIDEELIKNKEMPQKLQQMTEKLAISQLQRMRLQQLCISKSEKLTQIEKINSNLVNQKVDLQSKMKILQQQVRFTKVISDKIQLSWSKLDNEVRELYTIKITYEKAKKEDEFEVLSQNNEEDNPKNIDCPKMRLQQLILQVQKSLLQLRLEIKRLKQLLSNVSEDKIADKDLI